VAVGAVPLVDPGETGVHELAGGKSARVECRGRVSHPEVGLTGHGSDHLTFD
jgi:hypothetical protein